VWISDRSSRLPRDAAISHPSNSCTPHIWAHEGFLLPGPFPVAKLAFQ
jgi:hypothetical protein